VTRDELERDLHDWIDGRLPPERARAFESALREHPDLALRASSYRAIGESPRDPDVPAAEGLEARAREPLGAAQASRHAEGPSHGFGWEALGAIGAAIVLAATLLPWALRDAAVPETVLPAAPLARAGASGTFGVPVERFPQDSAAEFVELDAHALPVEAQRLSPDPLTERVVLVRGPFGTETCRRVQVESSETRVRIVFDPLDGSDPARTFAGCAVRIPAAPAAVEIVRR